MISYLSCIRSHRGSNDDACRNMAKSYLSCRMERYVAPLSVVPFQTYSPVNIAFALYCTRSTLFRCSSKGGGHAVTPLCQNESDRVYGMLQTAGGRVHLRSKMKRLGYIPCILTRSETPQPPAAVRLSYVFLIRPVALQYCQPLPPSPPPPLPSVTLPRQLPSADQHSVKSIFNG
jgi:hypothetical protein